MRMIRSVSSGSVSVLLRPPEHAPSQSLDGSKLLPHCTAEALQLVDTRAVAYAPYTALPGQLTEAELLALVCDEVLLGPPTTRVIVPLYCERPRGHMITHAEVQRETPPASRCATSSSGLRESPGAGLLPAQECAAQQPKAHEPLRAAAQPPSSVFLGAPVPPELGTTRLWEAGVSEQRGDSGNANDDAEGARSRRCSADSCSPSSPVIRGLSPSYSFASVASDLSDGSDMAEADEVALNRYLEKVSGQGQAALELFLRLNHARQTVDYVKRMMSSYAQLDRGCLGVWDALELLNTLREYQTALMGEEDDEPDMPLMEHALQTAEACRVAYPDHDWLHLVGLLHSLGKLLAHKKMGALPQWSVCGESFPVGCRFSQKVVCHQFFSVNPDRRRRMYNSSTGMYRAGCGLKSVYMSWGGAEYMHLVLVLNRARLPPEALFVLRHQNFTSLLRGAYKDLLNDEDRSHMVWLQRFKALSVYKRRPVEGALRGAALQEYYDSLIHKYIPGWELNW